MYTILSFGDGLELVPTKWVTEDKCFYPPYLSRARIDQAVQGQEDPKHPWKLYKVKCLIGKAESYQQGKEKLEKAYEESEIETNYENRRLNKRRKLSENAETHCDNFSDSGDEVLLPTLQRLPTEPELQFSEQHSSEPICNRVTQQNESPNSFPVLTTPGARNKSNKEAGFQEFVKNCLSQIMKTQNEICQRLKILEENILENKKKTEGEKLDESDFQFPIEDIESFENKLNDKAFFRKTVNTLKGIGGTDKYTIIVNILKKVMKNETALEYSLLGAKKKKSFKDLTLYKVVLETVRLHRDTTEAEFNDVLARWLVQAKLRSDRAEQQKMKGKEKFS